MAISKEKKQETLVELKNAIEQSGSVVFVNFHGLSVEVGTKIRDSLRKEGVSFLVSKKTLIQKVLKESSVGGEIPEMQGQVAIAYGEDQITPAREIYSFQTNKETKDLVKVLGGIFEGSFMKMEEMVSIATIPPVPVLRGMFVNVLNSPIQSFVIALDQIAKAKVA